MSKPFERKVMFATTEEAEAYLAEVRARPFNLASNEDVWSFYIDILPEDVIAEMRGAVLFRGKEGEPVNDPDYLDQILYQMLEESRIDNDPDYVDYIIEQQIKQGEEQYKEFTRKLIRLINKYGSDIDDNSVVFIEDNKPKEISPAMKWEDGVGFIKLDEPDIVVNPLYSDEYLQSKFLFKVKLSKNKYANYGSVTVFYYYDCYGDGGYTIAIPRNQYTPELMELAKDMTGDLFKDINKDAIKRQVGSDSGTKSAVQKQESLQERNDKIIADAEKYLKARENPRDINSLLAKKYGLTRGQIQRIRKSHQPC